MDNESNTTGFIQAAPLVCPGCGRCNVCGRGPAPAPAPNPCPPTPYIPGTGPWQPWTSPFINGGGSTVAQPGGIHISGPWYGAVQDGNGVFKPPTGVTVSYRFHT